METIKDLKEKLAQEVPNKVGAMDVTYEEGRDLEFKIDGNLVAWINNTSFEEEHYNMKIERALSVSSGLLFKHLGQIAQIGKWFEVEVDDNFVITKEVTKEVESPEQHKLIGKVEAYENILLGREVNIGR